ncbi:hypothetical protein ACFOOP_14290 [Marinicaulis aureus]|uniref:Uncharacterized protein n=1 Tax=Hyphococcus aureus TaxID=2666033 RepID=A0ABW1KY00_9PROT
MAIFMRTGLAVSWLFALAACSGGEEVGSYDGAAYSEEDFISEEELAEIEAVDPEMAAELRREMAAMRQQSYQAPGQPGGPAAPQASVQLYQTAMNAGAQPGASGPAQQPRQQQPPQQMSAGGKGLPPGAHRVKRVEIIDRSGFEKPLTAYTMMVPVDWNGQGGVVWGQNMGCGGGGSTVNYSASSPDGRSGVQLMPSFSWSWNNFSGPGQTGGCPFLQIGGIKQYIEYLVSQTRPGARIIDFRPREDIAEPFKQFNANNPMPGMDMRSWVEAGEALIAYNGNGGEIRETIAAVALINYSRMQDTSGMGMGDMEILAGSAMPAYAMRAPNGQLDFNFTELVRKSIREAPEWSQRMARHNAKIAQTNLKGAQDRSRIIARTGSDILDMQMESWRNQNASSDRIQRESTEAILGVETYNDPYNGGTVQLDNTYDNAWQLNDGSFVLTDDAMFEPYRDLGMDGQRLEAAQ